MICYVGGIVFNLKHQKSPIPQGLAINQSTNIVQCDICIGLGNICGCSWCMSDYTISQVQWLSYSFKSCPQHAKCTQNVNETTFATKHG